MKTEDLSELPVSAPIAQWKQKIGQTCSCLSLESMFVEVLVLQDSISCIFFVCFLKNRWIFPNEDNLLPQML